MSQEKVAKYKEEKDNRKAIMKKQKIAKITRNSIVTLVLVAVVGWVGYSAVAYYQDNKLRKTVEVDYAALNEYTNGLSVE